MTERVWNIAIIGGGASGTITAIQLLRKLNVPATIYLIEKRAAATYRGAAYSGQLPYQPLNVTASKMSLYNHLPDDFYNWLKEKKQPETKEEITRDSYVSRRWFGDYLTDTVERVKERTKLATLQVINCEACDIDFNARKNCYQLALANGETVAADYVVFATGNETPFDILSSYNSQLQGRYEANPWYKSALNSIKANDDVLVIGTGLTMVDYVVSLKQRGHQGKIICLSRNGYLPREHVPAQDFIFELHTEPKNTSELFRAIRSRIIKAAEQGIAWQNVLDAMRPRTARLWRGLDADSKKYFLKRFKTYWEIHRHRMPAASAKAIEELRSKGQLVVLAGSITDVQNKDGRLEIGYLPRKDSAAVTFHADYIINCTGPLSDYYKCENKLIKNLLNKGWMQQDELKLGIKTGIKGEVIKQNGVVLTNAFCIGPLRKALEWESTAVREIRTHAENVAFNIAGQTERNYELEVEIGL